MPEEFLLLCAEFPPTPFPVWSPLRFRHRRENEVNLFQRLQFGWRSITKFLQERYPSLRNGRTELPSAATLRDGAGTLKSSDEVPGSVRS